MLDELYKTAVVLITKHYVDVDSDLPAGTAAIALFDAMKEKRMARGAPLGRDGTADRRKERAT